MFGDIQSYTIHCYKLTKNCVVQQLTRTKLFQSLLAKFLLSTPVGNSEGTSFTGELNISLHKWKVALLMLPETDNGSNEMRNFTLSVLISLHNIQVIK